MRKLMWRVVACTGFVCLGALASWWRGECPSRSELKAQGEQLIAAVERYRAQRGEYPAALTDAGVSSPVCEYGPWRYERSGTHFALSVGDYGRDWFVLSYVSGGRGWHLDD